MRGGGAVSIFHKPRRPSPHRSGEARAERGIRRVPVGGRGARPAGRRSVFAIAAHTRGVSEPGPTAAAQVLSGADPDTQADAGAIASRHGPMQGDSVGRTYVAD